MEQDDFLARKEQILNRNSAKNFKEFNIENELKKLPAKLDRAPESRGFRLDIIKHTVRRHRLISRFKL